MNLKKIINGQMLYIETQIPDNGVKNLLTKNCNDGKYTNHNVAHNKIIVLPK